MDADILKNTMAIINNLGLGPMVSLLAVVVVITKVMKSLKEMDDEPGDQLKGYTNNSVEPVLEKWVGTPPNNRGLVGQRICPYCGRGFQKNHNGYCRGCGGPLPR